MTLALDNHRQQGEISYDLIMIDGMSFVEGTYRIDSGEWKVFIVSKGPVQQAGWSYSTWDSGVEGIVIEVPAELVLSMATVEALLSQAICCGEWYRVRGPDSITLR